MGRGCKTDRCDVHKGCWLAINKENHFSSAWPSFSLASPEADLKPTLTRRGTPAVDVAPLTGGEKPPALLSTTKIMLPFWAFMFVCTIFCFRNHLSFLTSARHELTGGEVTAKNLKKSKSWKHGIWFNFRFAKKRNTFWFPRNFFLLSKKRGTYFYSHFITLPRLSVNFHPESEIVCPWVFSDNWGWTREVSGLSAYAFERWPLQYSI